MSAPRAREPSCACSRCSASTGHRARRASAGPARWWRRAPPANRAACATRFDSAPTRAAPARLGRAHVLRAALASACARSISRARCCSTASADCADAMSSAASALGARNRRLLRRRGPSRTAGAAPRIRRLASRCAPPPSARSRRARAGQSPGGRAKSDCAGWLATTGEPGSRRRIVQAHRVVRHIVIVEVLPRESEAYRSGRGPPRSTDSSPTPYRPP